MGDGQVEAVGEARETKGAVRLRVPERRQMAMVVRCADDLVAAEHAVRMGMALVETLDLSRFAESIQAREGVAGRDATDPRLLVGLWLYACIRGIGSARELARRCEESAAFRWLCGGVTVNHRLLSEFRVDQRGALDELFTQVIASLVDKELVKVSRVSQDGVRVRVSAGAGSFRREERLRKLLAESQRHVEELRRQLENPACSAGLTGRQKAARGREAAEKQQRLEQAIAQLPELKRRQAETAKKAGQGKHGQKIRNKQPRVSTSDGEARVMKMPNGGFHPACNVQLATDTESRAIVGVEVSHEGSDSTGLSAPMREQVEQRSGGQVEQHLLDGGYLRMADIEQAQEQGVELFVPPKPARQRCRRGRELEPKAGDSAAVLAWKRRMGERRRQRNLPAAGGDQRNRQRRPAQLSRAHPVHGTRAGQGKMRGAVVCTGLQRDALWRGAVAVSAARRQRGEEINQDVLRGEGWRNKPATPPAPAADRFLPSTRSQPSA
jgi:transposase